MVEILGRKGANLAELSLLGIPVPAGFTITPAASIFYISETFNSVEKFNYLLQLEDSLKTLEEKTKTCLTSNTQPCFLSVRSGSSKSMPGMMDTVLNLGMNDSVVESLIRKTGDYFFVYDCYQRFLKTYGTIVLKIPNEPFEDRLESLESPTEVDLKDICSDFKKIIKDNNKVIPNDSRDQLREAIRAVYLSWFNPQALTYRKTHNIPEIFDTAVTVQAMVYGNRNENSHSGVIFSRDCLSGSNSITGEYLTRSQGDDIVGGIKTPKPISLSISKDLATNFGYSEEDRLSKLNSLEELNPKMFTDLVIISKKLENHFKEAQDIEFTIENGVLWILQARTAKKTKKANYVIQKSLFIEGIISEEDLLDRTQRYKLDSVKKLNVPSNTKALSVGLAASSGVTSGQIVFNSLDASSKKFSEMILVREQTETSDLDGILSANGTLTANGGTTSHAAVVCRDLNKACIVGAKIQIDYVSKKVKIGDRTLEEGDWLSLDGDSGEIFYGKLEII